MLGGWGGGGWDRAGQDSGGVGSVSMLPKTTKVRSAPKGRSPDYQKQLSLVRAQGGTPNISNHPRGVQNAFTFCFLTMLQNFKNFYFSIKEQIKKKKPEDGGVALGRQRQGDL